MVVTVYTSERPARGHRAWILSALFLLGVLALAADMVSRRAGDPLAARLEPATWPISFRPPRGFLVGQPRVTLREAVIPFLGRSPDGQPVRLDVYRFLDPPPGGAQALCHHVIDTIYTGPVPLMGIARVTSFDRKLGSRDAVEVWDPALRVVVRAALLDSQQAYGVSLAVDGPALGEATYRLFDVTCRSFAFRDR